MDKWIKWEVFTKIQVMNRYDSRKKLIVLALLSFCIALWFQGSRSIFDSTEGRYTQSAYEMLLSKNFLIPTLGGEPHWTKPPLTYWAIATGIELFGPNEWGARAFLVVAFVFTVLIVYKMAALLVDAKTAWYSALIYTVSPLPVAASNVISTDTLLTLWEALALYYFWHAIRHKKQTSIVLMWLSFGLGFLTKGPPCLIFLSGIIPVYFILRHRDSSLPKLITWQSGFVFLGAGLSWFLIIAVRDPTVLHYWILHEVINRVVTNEFHRNSQWINIISVYGTTFLLGSFPWFLLVLWNFKNLWAGVKRLFSISYIEQNIEIFFLVLCLVFPFIIFSLSKSRLPLYLVPLFIPLSILFGLGFVTLQSRKNYGTFLFRTFFIISLVCCLVGKPLYAKIPSKKDHKIYARLMQSVLLDQPVDEFVFLGDRPWYGLQFYLKKPFIHIDRKVFTQWEKKNLPLSMQRSLDSPHSVLITLESITLPLQEYFNSKNIPCRYIRIPRYQDIREIEKSIQPFHPGKDESITRTKVCFVIQ